MEQQSSGNSKIGEYVERIRGGEDTEKVLQGLPQSWVEQVQQQLQPEPLISISNIPLQYRGMSAEALEEIWANGNNIPVLVDQSPEDRVKEINRRAAVVNELSRLENKFEDRTDNESNPSNKSTERGNQQLLKEIEDAQRAIYFSKRGHLSDEMFMVSKGVIENEDGTEQVYEKVDGIIGKAFDAHGIDKGNQLENLLNLLSNGVDPTRTFFSAPFEIPDEERKALAAALGTSGGTAYKAGIAVLTSGPNQTLSHNGIKHVFINDVYGALVQPLTKLYPKYQFHLLSDQKSALETEYKNSQSSNTN